MTGPEHYTEAERLLSLADYESDHAPQSAADRRADALVHAILAAAAAAIAAPFVGEGNTTEAWLRVTSSTDTEAGESR